MRKEKGALLRDAARRSVQRDFFLDNLLVRIHLIVKMSLVDRPCDMAI